MQISDDMLLCILPNFHLRLMLFASKIASVSMHYCRAAGRWDVPADRHHEALAVSGGVVSSLPRLHSFPQRGSGKQTAPHTHTLLSGTDFGILVFYFVGWEPLGCWFKKNYEQSLSRDFRFL